MKEFYNNYLDKNHKFDRWTMVGILALLIVIAGCFGWLYEFIFYFFNGGMKTFYWRGGNFLPWINIYATGSVMIYYLTYKHRKKYIVKSNPVPQSMESIFNKFLINWYSRILFRSRNAFNYP